MWLKSKVMQTTTKTLNQNSNFGYTWLLYLDLYIKLNLSSAISILFRLRGCLLVGCFVCFCFFLFGMLSLKISFSHKFRVNIEEMLFVQYTWLYYRLERQTNKQTNTNTHMWNTWFERSSRWELLGSGQNGGRAVNDTSHTCTTQASGHRAIFRLNQLTLLNGVRNNSWYMESSRNKKLTKDMALFSWSWRECFRLQAKTTLSHVEQEFKAICWTPYEPAWIRIHKTWTRHHVCMSAVVSASRVWCACVGRCL